MNPKKVPNKKNNNLRRFIFLSLALIFGISLTIGLGNRQNLDEVPISEVINQLNTQTEIGRNPDRTDYPNETEKNQPEFISKILNKGAEVQVHYAGEEEASKVSYSDYRGTLEEQGLLENGSADGGYEIETDKGGAGGLALFGTLLNIFIPIAILVFLFLIIKSAQGQGSQALGFGRSKARLYGNEKSKITFADIAGNSNAKEDLEEVVDFLKNPGKFKGVKAKIPKGVLLVGPPGTGKTMIARAVAGEAKVPFYTISGSEFVEMFVGVGASRVRDLFTKAKKNSPCIIFVDEIDAVGRRRGAGLGGGHDEREQTLNQILVEMDGFEQGENVIVLAATNRADVLDPALLRPGRFDRRVDIPLPDRRDRLDILKVHLKDKPVTPNVDIEALAVKTTGSSGADLSNIVNESAIRAARHNRRKITNEDVVEAFEKLALGPTRKKNFMDQRERELTAYHETGHAIVGHVLPLADPIHKVTIVSRGHALGVTWSLPETDKYSHSVLELKDRLAQLLGGRMADRVIWGEEMVNTGAASDLQKATSLARKMVVEYGMGSQELRHQVFPSNDGIIFDKIVQDKLYSEQTSEQIDLEVQSLVREAADRAEAIVRTNLRLVEDLKDILLEKETVEADEVEEVFADARLPEKAKLFANGAGPSRT